MDLDHNGHEGHVEQHLDEAWQTHDAINTSHQAVTMVLFAVLRDKAGVGLGGVGGCTSDELCVEHVDSLVVPGVLTLQVNGVQQVLGEGGQHHGHQDGVLQRTWREQFIYHVYMYV